MRYSAKGAAVLLAAAVLLSGCTGTSVNHPPVIGSFEPKGDASMPEEGALVFRLNASDPDGQALSCRWYVDGNLSLRTAKPFAFNYTPGRAVGVHAVKAVVSDGSLTARKNWTVAVYDINHAPLIDAGPSGGGARTVNEGSALAFTANVTDPDGDAVWLRWTLDGTAVSVNTSAYTLVPDFNMSGAHRVRLLAGDANATSEVVWNVTVINVDRAPRLTAWSPPADVHIRELASQPFCATAADDDGDAVQYRWSVDGATAGEGPTFDYTTGYFSAGKHTVSVTAGDGDLSDSHSWAVKVDNLNRPPRIVSHDPAGDAAATEYGSLALSLGGADDDGDALSVLWYIDNGSTPSGTGQLFNYTPGYDSAGNRTVTAVLSDGTDSVARSWNVSVTRATADWTVLAYMNADDDLEPYLVEDFNEMEQAGSTERVNIVVQMDRHPAYDPSSGDWNDTRRYRVEHDGELRAMSSRLLEDLGELDMGDQKTLSDFLLWGLQKFPARRYQVVLSGHGEGWSGISQDFTNQNDRLTLDELAGALGAFASARGAPADVLLLDVCYWAMLETDWTLRGLASYIVASEDIDPSAGQRYDMYLGDLVKAPETAPRDLAVDLVETFREAYASGGYYPGDSETFTQSAVETAGLGALASALDGLCSYILGNMTALAPAVTAARNGVETYGKPEYIDIHEFVLGLRAKSAQDGLNTTADAVLAAINATVAASAGGTLRSRSRGISIYFPAQSYSFKAAYSELAFSREHSWDGLLKEYYNATGRSSEGRSAAGAPAGAPSPAGSPDVSFSERKMLYLPGTDWRRFTFAGGS
jgi:hypothetical protein